MSGPVGDDRRARLGALQRTRVLDQHRPALEALMAARLGHAGPDAWRLVSPLEGSDGLRDRATAARDAAVSRGTISVTVLDTLVDVAAHVAQVLAGESDREVVVSFNRLSDAGVMVCPTWVFAQLATSLLEWDGDVVWATGLYASWGVLLDRDVSGPVYYEIETWN